MKHISEYVNGAQTAIPAKPIDTPAPDKQRATLDQLDATHHPLVKTAVQAAKTWASRKRSGVGAASLVLVAKGVQGDINRTGYGCGKTHIAKAVLWSIAYVLDDKPVAPAGKFFTANQLIQNLDASTPAKAEIANAPIVVIDDVGAEQLIKYTSKEAQQAERWARYFKVIDYCYQTNTSAVLTANMSLDELSHHIGGRAWSRLLEMAPRGCMVDMTGVPDWRRKEGGR